MSNSYFILQGLESNNDHIAGLDHLFALNPIEHGLVATAFINAAGASIISELIGEHRDVIDVFLGIRNGVTSMQALDLLLQNGIMPYVVDTASQTFIFHPKVFITNNSYSARLIVGSANATTGGMAKNVEASILSELSMDEDRELIGSVYGQFNQLRNHYPENVFRVASFHDLTKLVDEGLLIDEARITWHANTRSHTGERIDRRKSMQLNTRNLPRTTRVVHSQEAYEPVDGIDLTVATVINNNLLWKSGELTRRDLNIPTGLNTNRTGSMLFKKGDPSQDIDQRFYFREEVFANAEWSYDVRPAYSHIERCICDFRFIIKGIDYGVYSLRLSHNTRTDTATFQQRNSMTQIHWGAALPLVSREDLLGSICRLYAPDENFIYTLVFDDE